MSSTASSRKLELDAADEAVDTRPIDVTTISPTGASRLTAGLNPVDAAAQFADLEAARAGSTSRPPKPEYVFPKARVALAIFLLVLGIGLSIAGLSKGDWALGVPGGVLLLPGVFASFVYFQIWRGDPRFRREEWLIRVDDY